MNNLTTRKIILGLLMTCVLAFGVQDIANALSEPTIGPTDLSFLSINGQITVSEPTFGNSEANVKESIYISVSGGSANFLDPDDDNGVRTTTSETWTEPAAGDGTFDKDFPSGGVAITVHSAGEVTVTVSYTTNDATSSTRNRSIVQTYYVVKQAYQVNLNDTVKFLGVTNGVGAGYGATDDFKIHSGDGKHNRVNYIITGGGTLYIKEGSRDNKESRTAGAALETSSSADVWLQMVDSSQTVTATVLTSQNETEAVYILRVPRLSVTAAAFDGTTHTAATEPPDNPVITNPVRLMGNPEDVITADAIMVQVKQSTLSGQTVVYTTDVPNVLVKFDVADKSVTGGYLIPDAGTTIVDSSNNPLDAANIPRSARTLYVRADDSSTAVVGFQFGTAQGTSDVIVSVVGTRVNIKKTVEVVIGDETSKQLSANTPTRESGNSRRFELVAVVKDKDDKPIWGERVTFRTRFGELINTPTGETIPAASAPGDADVEDTTELKGRLVTDITTRSGQARVFYDLGTNTGRQEIFASIDDGTNNRQEATFVIGGPSARRDPPPTTPARLDISVFGEDGDTSRAVIVNALNSAGQAVSINIPVTLSGSALATSQTVNTGAVTTITPPTTPGSYTLIATDPAGIYASDTETITVGGPSGEGTLDVTTVGVPVNGQQTIEVTLEDADGDAPAGEVVVRLTGPGISRTVDTLRGSGRAIIPLPNTATYTLRLSADGYATREVTLSVSGVVQDDTETQTRDTTPAGGARSVRIASDPFPSGTANRRLAQPLRVQVLDANNRGVASVRVTFEVVSGQGRLSQRGNGRAIRALTDPNGNASANYTPLADGTSRVRATAAGVTQTVTFTITAGAAAPSPDETTPSDTGVTPSREINPDVHVRAAQRPPMLWVDGGKIYALVGADVEEFGSGVEGAMNIAVGGGKVYWTEMTGESRGTINSAKLDGSDVKELKKIKAVPMGIAVDTAGDKLYWTNSRGRIQSADLDGSGIENVMLDLPGPMDIAVARGNLYWTQYDATEEEGNVGIVNPTAGRKVARYISTGSDMPGSIVIGGNKVYWTEMTGSNAGTINSASLNGSGATELNDIRAVPMGIGVDTARSKLYWTNSRGRVQSANLEGRKIQNVVDGLDMPGDMVLSNSITAPAKAPTTDAEQTASTSKYDINGDGSVDSKDVDALIVAVAAGVTDAKYDVNGDGKVDIFDVSAVSSKRDDGAASAPALLGTKLSIVQIDRLQDQIDLLIASNDRSPDTMRLLIYLQQLIVMARPEKTQLLANYPNPFNPETWIPYELATDTTVKITIYNTQGVVIRTLALGHQSAGYYTGRDRAAYWDGRNALGEQVASGIYFYQFETDEMSSMRKMVILK